MRMAVSHLGTTTLQYMSCYRYPEPTKVNPQHWCGEFKEIEQ